MKIVISLGGSIITSDLSAKKLKQYANVLKRLVAEGHRLVVVCGGGKTSRDYVNVAKELTTNQSKLDLLAILPTYMNAMLVILALDDYSYPVVVKSSEEFLKAWESGKIVVAGGYEPGHSTDLRAAIFAELIEADLLINATNVDGVYDSDPRKNPNAKKFKELTYKQFFELMKNKSFEACGYSLFDLAAIKIIERSKIKTVIIDGNDPEEIYRAVKGNHNGTIVS